MASEQLNSVVVGKVRVSPTMLTLRVAPKGWELAPFIPGQFTVLGLPGSASRCDEGTPEQEAPPPEKLIKRAYSVASSSKEKEFLELYVALVHSGALSPRIFNLNVGDPIWMSEKCKGMFVMEDVPSDANIILICTGTGVAPYMSMLRSQAKLNSSRKIVVMHGASNSWDLGYSSELILLQSMISSFTYIPTILIPEKEPIPWKQDTEMVQDLWVKGAVEKNCGFKPDPSNTHIFLCGNPKMIEAMIQVLAKDQFKEHKRSDPGQIHVERF